jgi:hypothetical protein
MSNLLKKRRPTTDGTEIRPSSAQNRIVIAFACSWLPTAKKQRFIDGMKSLLDIANESADAFPPLKSCLGGINALMKYYEVRLHSIVHDLADPSTLGMQRR